MEETSSSNPDQAKLQEILRRRDELITAWENSTLTNTNQQELQELHSRFVNFRKKYGNEPGVDIPWSEEIALEASIREIKEEDLLPIEGVGPFHANSLGEKAAIRRGIKVLGDSILDENLHTRGRETFLVPPLHSLIDYLRVIAQKMPSYNPRDTTKSKEKIPPRLIHADLRHPSTEMHVAPLAGLTKEIYGARRAEVYNVATELADANPDFAARLSKDGPTVMYEIRDTVRIKRDIALACLEKRLLTHRRIKDLIAFKILQTSDIPADYFPREEVSTEANSQVQQTETTKVRQPRRNIAGKSIETYVGEISASLEQVKQLSFSERQGRLADIGRDIYRLIAGRTERAPELVDLDNQIKGARSAMYTGKNKNLLIMLDEQGLERDNALESISSYIEQHPESALARNTVRYKRAIICDADHESEVTKELSTLFKPRQEGNRGGGNKKSIEAYVGEYTPKLEEAMQLPFAERQKSLSKLALGFYLIVRKTEKPVELDNLYRRIIEEKDKMYARPNKNLLDLVGEKGLRRENALTKVRSFIDEKPESALAKYTVGYKKSIVCDADHLPEIVQELRAILGSGPIVESRPPRAPQKRSPSHRARSPVPKKENLVLPEYLEVPKDVRGRKKLSGADLIIDYNVTPSFLSYANVSLLGVAPGDFAARDYSVGDVKKLLAGWHDGVGSEYRNKFPHWTYEQMHTQYTLREIGAGKKNNSEELEAKLQTEMKEIIEVTSRDEFHSLSQANASRVRGQIARLVKKVR